MELNSQRLAAPKAAIIIKAYVSQSEILHTRAAVGSPLENIPSVLHRIEFGVEDGSASAGCGRKQLRLYAVCSQSDVPKVDLSIS
jgi:hypothetical protein